MMFTPMVTVITLTKNRDKLILRAISSILNQSFIDFEYFILDGSTDNKTRSLVNEINDDRIIYKHFNKNISVHESLDYAITLSKGKYLSFLDDDDEYLLEKLNKQVALFENLDERYALVSCLSSRIDDSTGNMIELMGEDIRGNIFLQEIERPVICGTSSMLLRTDVYKEFNGWNRSLKFVSDWEFITRISRKYLVEVVPEILVMVHVNHMYQRQTQAQGNANISDNLQNMIEFHEYFINEFNEGFIQNPKASVSHFVPLMRFYYLSGEYLKFLLMLRKFLFLCIPRKHKIKILSSIVKRKFSNVN